MSNLNTIVGKDVFVYFRYAGDWQLVGCGISCTFESENELIQRTGINDGLFVKKRVRRTDWRGSVTGVMVADSNSPIVSQFYLLEEQVRREEQEVKFEFTAQDSSVKSITGRAVIRTIPFNADESSFAKFDVQLEGTGAFSLSEGSSPSTLVDENVDSDYWTVTPGTSQVSGNSVNGKNTTGKVLLAVSRSGTAHDIITSGSPVNRQAKHNTLTGSTTFDADIPFMDGESVWQMWKDA